MLDVLFSPRQKKSGKIKIKVSDSSEKEYSNEKVGKVEGYHGGESLFIDVSITVMKEKLNVGTFSVIFFFSPRAQPSPDEATPEFMTGTGRSTETER